MAYLLSGERPSVVAFAFTAPVRAFVRALAKARAKRAQQVALATLLEFDTALLRDIGVERQDLFEAMRQPNREAGLTLARRRARNADLWLKR